jgi:hypothetical protein
MRNFHRRREEAGPVAKDSEAGTEKFRTRLGVAIEGTA